MRKLSTETLDEKIDELVLGQTPTFEHAVSECLRMSDVGAARFAITLNNVVNGVLRMLGEEIVEVRQELDRIGVEKVDTSGIDAAGVIRDVIVRLCDAAEAAVKDVAADHAKGARTPDAKPLLKAIGDVRDYWLQLVEA